MIRSSRGAAILLLAFLSAATTGLQSGIARPPRVLDLEERVATERIRWWARRR